jgi:putative oxidoreductase
MRRLTDPLAFVGRVLLAFIFVKEGIDAIGRYSDVAGYMESSGVSARLLPLVILVQLGGGLSVLTGFLTRLGAIALGGFCLLTALMFHRNWADFNEAIQFQKDFCMAGGFLVLAAFGPGLWSVDAWLGRRGWRL